MEEIESDPHELLKEIACPEQRARTAREWGVLDDDANAHLYCSGSGPQVQINAAILNDRKPWFKSGSQIKQEFWSERAMQLAKQNQVLAGTCPFCGRG